jgi:hypothetical protein
MKSFHDHDPAPFAHDWDLASYPPQERIGVELKTLFETLTSGPMPDRLLQLADALEEAFQRGELFEPRNLDA